MSETTKSTEAADQRLATAFCDLIDAVFGRIDPKNGEKPVDLRDFEVTRAEGESGKASDGPEILHPGSVFHIEADLEWLTAEGPRPRRLMLMPTHGKHLLERLRITIDQPLGVDPRLLKPGGVLYVPDPPRTDLDDVLDGLRRAGVKCGVQIVSASEVVCWLGDIQENFLQPQWRAWGLTPPPVLLHKTHGSDALEGAAKWLSTHLEAIVKARAGPDSPQGSFGSSSGEIGRG